MIYLKIDKKLYKVETDVENEEKIKDILKPMIRIVNLLKTPYDGDGIPDERVVSSFQKALQQSGFDAVIASSPITEEGKDLVVMFDTKDMEG